MKNNTAKNCQEVCFLNEITCEILQDALVQNYE